MDSKVSRNRNYYYYNILSSVTLRPSNYPEKLILKCNDLTYCNALRSWLNKPDSTPVSSKQHVYRRIVEFFERGSRCLDLSGLQLRTIPPLSGLTQLSVLNLEKNNLSDCNPSAFSNNAELRILNLSHNAFSFFSNKSTICSNHLSRLYLNHNFFVNMNSFDFLSLPNLSFLDLNYNFISKIHQNAFSKLSSLHMLDLSHNCLSSVSTSVFSSLLDLTLLDLSYNKIVKFELADHQNLCNCIISLLQNPIRLHDAVSLYELQCSDGYKGPNFELSIVTNKFGMIESKMPEISSVDSPVKNSVFADYISKLNDWVALSDGTFQPNKIRVLENIVLYLSEVPKNQVVLDLSKLCLYSIPPLFGLKFLRALYLNSNYISSIPLGCLPKNTSLKLIDLGENTFAQLRGDEFKDQVNLETLRFTMNQFSSIEPFFFHHLPRLVDLNLQENSISEIHVESFLHQSSLKVLNLCFNSFLFFPSEALRPLSSLVNLDLSFNYLTEFNWPSDNLATPCIELSNNFFSLNSVALLNALQNAQGYHGPSFDLSVYLDTSISISHIELDSFLYTLSLWNHGDSIAMWDSFINEKDCDQRQLYNQFNIFLLRLYNEVPRLSDGAIPKNVIGHVYKILSNLEKYDMDSDLVNAICNMSSDALGSCVDRIGIVLLMMSLYSEAFDAKKMSDVSKFQAFSDQIRYIKQIIQFVDDIDSYKIVMELRSHCFLRLSSLLPDPISLDGTEGVFFIDDHSKAFRQEQIVSLNQNGFDLRTFNIGDPVEDVFLILNFFVETGRMRIEQIDMRFACVATLRNVLSSVSQYFDSVFKD